MTNLIASFWAVWKPSDISMFSQMGLRSGLIIAQLLKSAFKFSGNGVRPAYPGFIVIQKPHVGMRSMIVPKKSNLPTLLGGVPADRCWYCSSLREGTAYFTMASWTVLTCVATTDNTSMEMRLNSSKQPQAPVWAKPRKMSAMDW